MKKKLLLVLLLNLGIGSMSYAQSPILNTDSSKTYIELQQLKYGTKFIPVGNIHASVTETIKLKPDTAEFSITYITDGTTPNDASNRNVSNMKQFKEYLTTLGISDDNLTTIDYQNYEQETQKSIIDENKKYQSSLKISLIINENQNFLDIVKILDENGIDNIKLDNYKNYYIFEIIETDSTPEKAKESVHAKYSTIAKAIKNINLHNFAILEYDNKETSGKNTIEKQYYVRNTIKIKVTDLELIGKIIAKAQELKMTANSDTHYSVSEQARNQAIEKYEETLLTKLNHKVERLLAKQYQIGAPTHLNSNEDVVGHDTRSRNYSYRPSVINSISSGNQLYAANDINIQPPSEFEITLTLSGTFEILKQINTITVQ